MASTPSFEWLFCAPLSSHPDLLEPGSWNHQVLLISVSLTALYPLPGTPLPLLFSRLLPPPALVLSFCVAFSPGASSPRWDVLALEFHIPFCLALPHCVKACFLLLPAAIWALWGQVQVLLTFATPSIQWSTHHRVGGGEESESVSCLCLTLCDPIDCSPPGFSVHGVLQARILVWGAIPFSRGSSRPRDWTWVSCIAGRFFTVWATREAQYCQISEWKSEPGGIESWSGGIYYDHENDWALGHTGPLAQVPDTGGSAMLTFVSQAGEVTAATVAEPQPGSSLPPSTPSFFCPTCFGGGGPAPGSLQWVTPHWWSIPPSRTWLHQLTPFCWISQCLHLRLS